MSTFLLVHGAWHGGWCWSRVAAQLGALGHATITPTLPGLAERAHELVPELGLADHADAIAGELRSAPEPVVLVGHSYAGFVVRQAADQQPDAVRRIVLLDAWFGPDGTSLFDQAPDWFRQAIEDMARGSGDPTSIPPPPPEMVGVTDPADGSWLSANLTPHPMRSFVEPTRLTGAVDAIPTSAIVVEPSIFPFRALAEAAGLHTTVIESAHDAMVTTPEALVAHLVDAPGA